MNTKKAPAGAGTRDKDSNFVSQYKATHQCFKEKPKTMLTVSIELGVLRANICRYIATMEKKGLIQEIREGLCPYTHCMAGFYTTDESLFKNPNVKQPCLFDDENEAI